MLVHQSQSGQVIGKGGEKVKQLRAVSVLQYFCCSYVSRKLCTVFLFLFSAHESLGCTSCMWQTSRLQCSCMQPYIILYRRGTLFPQTCVQFQTAVVLNQNLKPIFFNQPPTFSNLLSFLFYQFYFMRTTNCVAQSFVDFRPLLCTYVLILPSNRHTINL